MNEFIAIALWLMVASVFLIGAARFLERRAKMRAKNTIPANLRLAQESGLTVQQMDWVQAKLKLEQQFNGSAGWFFWIAGMSIVNTVLVLIGSQSSFPIGLAITQIIDGFTLALTSHLGANSGMLVHAVALWINLCIASLFALWGVLARKRYGWALVVGMVLYGLDALLFLLIADWLSLGLHAFVLVSLYSGLQARGKLKRLEESHLQAAAA